MMLIQLSHLSVPCLQTQSFDNSDIRQETEYLKTELRGWKIRHVDGKSARRTFLLSEDGSQFACRRAAYQYMISKQYSELQLQVNFI